MWKKTDIPDCIEVLKAAGYSDIASLVMAKAGVDSKMKHLKTVRLHDLPRVKPLRPFTHTYHPISKNIIQQYLQCFKQFTQFIL